MEALGEALRISERQDRPRSYVIKAQLLPDCVSVLDLSFSTCKVERLVL